MLKDGSVIIPTCMLEIDVSVGLDHHIPEVAKKLVDGEAVRCFKNLCNLGSITEEERDRREILLRSKIRHTVEVVEATDEVIMNSHNAIENTNLPWNTTQAKVIAAFHDIGRFSEAVIMGSNDRRITKFDHGDSGARILEGGLDASGVLELSKLGCDLPVIISAVRYHDKSKLKNDDPYLKLIRDADKLAYLRHMLENPSHPAQPEIGIITPEVEREFNKAKLINIHKLKTTADETLYLLAWFLDFNYEATREIAIREKIINKTISRLNSDPATRERVVSTFEMTWNRQSKAFKIKRESI